jgi:tetratricopeptide (TPR) repeat protein
VKRVNLRLLIALVMTVLVGVLSLVGVWRFQRWRNAGSLVALAKEAVADNRPLEAISMLQRYVVIRPEDDTAVADLADLTLKLCRAGDVGRQGVNQAHNLAEAAVRRNPDNDALRSRLAQFQLMLGNPGHAREHLERLAAKYPLPAAEETSVAVPPWDSEDATHPFSIQLMLINSLMATAEFEQAADKAATLIGFDRKSRAFDDTRSRTGPPDAFKMLAQIMLDHLDDQPGATMVFDQLTKAHGTKPETWLIKAGWHREQKDIQAAGEAIDRALEIDPENRAALFALLDLLLANRDLAKATDAANRCRELFPDDERSYRLLATVHFEQGRPDEAEKVLREGLAAAPGRPSLLLMLTEAALIKEDVQAASLAINRLREVLDPANPMVRFMEGQLLMAERKWLPAKRLLEEARARFGNNENLLPKIDFLLGKCYEQLGEHDAQYAASQRVLNQAPMAIEPRISAAAALQASGRTAEALAEFESIAALLPPERLATIPQIWYPLLTLRMAAQRQLPREKRDWSRIDGLLDVLRDARSVAPAQLAMLRADVLINKGESQAALETLEKAADGDAKSAELWMSLASLTLRDRGAAAAREVLGRVPEEFREAAGILVIEASVAVAAGSAATEDAFQRIETRAAALPDDEAARVFAKLASLRRSSGSQEEADRLWKLAVAKTPGDLRLHTARFDVALDDGDITRAAESLREIQRIDGEKSAQTRFAKAAVLVMQVRSSLEKRQAEGERAQLLTAEETASLAEAQALLIEAENERPGWNKIQVLFAEIAGLKDDLPAAIDRLQRAMRLGSVSPRVVRQLVFLLNGLNRVEEAQQVLASLGTEAAAGFGQLSAEMELKSGRLDEAVSVAERSVAADSRNPQELLWLGQLLDRAGRREQAGKWFEKAVEAGQERVDTWLNLIAYQIATGGRKAAEVTLDRAADALEEPKRTVCLAQGNEMLGRFEEAERHYRNAVAAAPTDADTKRDLAAFFLRRGQVAQAREPLRQIVDTAADGRPTVVWARRNLAEIMAQNANFRTLEQAVALVGKNLDRSGRLPPEDMAVQVALLSRRSEPVCWREAIDLIGKIADQRPLTMGEQTQLSELLEKTGRWEEARSGLMAICSAPNAPPAFIALLVEKLIAHDEIIAARTWLRPLQKQLPNSPATHALQARLALAVNDREAAVAAARQLLPAAEAEGVPRDQVVGLAKLLEDLGFAKAADRIISRLPEDSTDAIFVKVGFLGRQKRPDEALQLLEDHWTKLPLERVLQSAFDVVRHQEDPRSHAARLEAWLTKARREDPGSVMLAVMQAELREIEGRPEEVERIYRDVLARKDSQPQLQAIVANNLAFHLARPETAAEARRLVDSAIAELGPQPDLLDTRGLISLAAGDTKRALEDLREAALDPTAVKLLHLACAEFAAGDADAARRTLESARKKKLLPSRLSSSDRQRLEQLTEALKTAAAA